MSARTGRIAGLDGVRAIAVLGVIASHSGFVGLGWIGVDIFFGLSGYLITGILLDAKGPNTTAGEYFIPFYIRRALRIFPLAWAFAIAWSIYVGEAGGIFWYLAYVVNWLPETPAPRSLGHYWSLAVEEQFYTLWPAVVFLASSKALRRISLGVLALNVSLRFGVSMWPPDFATAQFRDLATFARADTLIIGALLAQQQRNGGWGDWPRRALPIALAAAFGIVGLRVLERMDLLPLLTYNLKWPMIDIGVGAGLLFVLTAPPRFLEWAWLQWIGKISYGVYVIHAVFGTALHDRFPLSQAPLIFLLQVAMTLPLAAASWYLFESPILSLKHKWPMHRPTEERLTSELSGPARF